MVSLRRAGERVKGGVLFREREHPLWSPQSSAHLVEVHLIIVYRGTHQCGERSNAAFGKQSAAAQTSLAPHDSKARLRVVTTCRRFMAKPCTPHPITRKGYATSVRQQSCLTDVQCAARAVLRAALLQWRGQGAEPLAFSWGSKGAILSRERMAPLSASPCTVQGNCNYIT